MTTSNVLPVVIGVDIGGTNTDAIILYNDQGSPKILSEVKEQTTSDVTDGVRKCVLRCLLQAKDEGYLVAPVQVNIGTTHLVNAVVQRRNLAKVSVIRLCGPISHDLPPFCDFPPKLADLICGSIHFVHGGCLYDGREREAIDEKEIREVVDSIRKEGIFNISVVGIFSPCRAVHELRVKEIVLEEFPEATVSLSHEIGNIGLLERENATILNECLKPLCKKTVNKFKTAFEDVGLDCPFFLTQNDGTIISSDDVLEFPVLTFASGPTNSMRGAAFLTSKKEAIVIDIGGTTSDAGMLVKGFPREASTNVRVGGVKTSFRMPDVVSIGLGGGSYVMERKNEDGGLHGVEVGPLSAGYNLKKEALVYSDNGDTQGRVLTATDIAVSAGLCSLGSKENVNNLDSNLVTKSMDKIHLMLEELVDTIKLSKEEVPVVIVGGGSVLVDKTRPFRGTNELIIPEHFGVANAIGAALSKMSATVHCIMNLLDLIDVEQMDRAVMEAKAKSNSSITQEIEAAVNNAKKPFLTKAREEAIEKCLDQAKSQVLGQGVNEDSLEVLEKSDTVLNYVPGNGLDIKVKIVGDLVVEKDNFNSWNVPKEYENILGKQSVHHSKQLVTHTGQALSTGVSEDEKDAAQYPKEPFIDASTGEWILSEWDIECIVIGAGIYGCGGGGSLDLGRIKALKYIRQGKKIRVIGAQKLLEKADPERDLILAPALIGSPTVALEQCSGKSEMQDAIQCVRDVYEIGRFKDGKLQNADGFDVEENDLGCRFISDYKPSLDDNKQDYKVIALMSLEFAGTNAIEPFLAAADMDIPVVDADGMTRAFPEVHMYIPFMYGKPPYPVSIVAVGYSGRHILLYAPEGKPVEYYLRDVCVENGCHAFFTVLLTKQETLTKTVPHIISGAWRLGDAILRARLEKQSITDIIVEQENGKHVITGKIVDVQKETSGGFNKGHLIIEGCDQWSGQTVMIEFQNEYLVIFDIVDGQKGDNKGSVPDLISIVDSDTGHPIQAEIVRYGMRVSVVLLPSCDMLRQPEALRKVAPQGFHYPPEVVFVPFGQKLPVQPIPPQ